MTLKRVAILLEKNLSPGEVGNVAAILMGQAAILRPEIYNVNCPMDTQGNPHAAIQYSTVVLKGGEGQILNLVQKLRLDHPSLSYALFSKTGQRLHNAYPEYKALIEMKPTEDLGVVGIVIVGEDEEVRQATKKFSLLQ